MPSQLPGIVRRGVWVLGSWALLFAICLEPAGVRAHDPISTKVTWVREISPILERHCVTCHKPNGYASFSLTTYEEARPWAVAIKEEVLSGEMPPWGAAPGVGHFANDRRPTRHEQELIASWVDGGAPYSLASPRRPPAIARASTPAQVEDAPSSGTSLPLAPASISAPTERAARVTLQLPQGMVLTAWTFEPGAPSIVERVDLELGTRWLGTWTPGEPSIEFPSDAGAPLAPSTLFTTRISYIAPPQAIVDHSRLRVWMAKEDRPKTLREVTVVKNWRPPTAVDLIALRPARDKEENEVQIVARYASGRAEPLGVFDPPSRGPHPTYRLERPLPLPVGSSIESSAPVRLLYSAGATRTVKPNVSRRPRR